MTAADDGPERDPVGSDPAVMATAMETGSEEGEPGDRAPVDEGPLTDDENDLLARFSHDDRPDVVTDAPEDSPAASRAAADDAPLPDDTVAVGGPDDGDTPEFRPPGR
jgi:hypothetical protein